MRSAYGYLPTYLRRYYLLPTYLPTYLPTQNTKQALAAAETPAAYFVDAVQLCHEAAVADFWRCCGIGRAWELVGEGGWICGACDGGEGVDLRRGWIGERRGALAATRDPGGLICGCS